MYNTICKFIDNVFLIFDTKKCGDRPLDYVYDDEGYNIFPSMIIHNNVAGIDSEAFRTQKDNKRKFFHKWYSSLPKAKRVTKTSSEFVTARTLYVERIDQGKIVVKFSRKDQIVLCSDGTWYIKGDK